MQANPIDIFVLAYVTDATLAEHVAAHLAGAVPRHALAGTPRAARRFLVEGPLPGAIIADHYDPNLVALAPHHPWVWLMDERTPVDRGVVLAPDHLHELIEALASAVNVARCDTAVRVLRRSERTVIPAAATPDIDAFEMHFQPRWSIDGTRFAGAEALVRWHGLEAGITPDRLVGTIGQAPVRLGDWIIDRTLGHAASWSTLWPVGATVSVNVTPGQLSDPGFATHVLGRLQAHRLPPARLALELDAAAVRTIHALEYGNLHALDAAGVRLVVDGAGRGMLDPARIARVPFSALKVDRRVVAMLPKRAHAAAVAMRLATLARHLGLRLHAVGVETEAQLLCCRKIGCDEFQGFLLAEALPPGELSALLCAHQEAKREARDVV